VLLSNAALCVKSSFLAVLNDFWHSSIMCKKMSLLVKSENQPQGQRIDKNERNFVSKQVKFVNLTAL
jgi:hypothetical protein